MLFILNRDYSALKILMYFFIVSFFTTSIEGASCNCCPPSSPPPIPIIIAPTPVKHTLPNDCKKWFPMPMEDNLVVVIDIYDHSIKEHDHDCDGIVDRLDTDVDQNGIVVMDDSAYIKKGESIYIDVLANDSDVDVGGYIDKNTLTIHQQPMHGTIQISNGKVSSLTTLYQIR